jgi:hypothetical protein
MPLSAKELAREFDTDARTLRKFLREASGLEAPGQGGRWNLEKKQAKSLKKKFDEWSATKSTRRQVADEVEGDEDVEDVEEIDDEDLEDIGEEEEEEDLDIDTDDIEEI